jgi:hypothetical protein
MDKTEKAVLRKRYQLAVELVHLLREYGIYIRVTCPRCGLEGTLTVLTHKHGYLYLVVRHSDKKTHAVPRSQINEVLCKIDRELVRIFELYKMHSEKFCTDAQDRAGEGLVLEGV